MEEVDYEMLSEEESEDEAVEEVNYEIISEEYSRMMQSKKWTAGCV